MSEAVETECGGQRQKGSVVEETPEELRQKFPQTDRSGVLGSMSWNWGFLPRNLLPPSCPEVSILISLPGVEAEGPLSNLPISAEIPQEVLRNPASCHLGDPLGCPSTPVPHSPAMAPAALPPFLRACVGCGDPHTVPAGGRVLNQRGVPDPLGICLCPLVCLRLKPLETQTPKSPAAV